MTWRIIGVLRAVEIEPMYACTVYNMNTRLYLREMRSITRIVELIWFCPRIKRYEPILSDARSVQVPDCFRDSITNNILFYYTLVSKCTVHLFLQVLTLTFIAVQPWREYVNSNVICMCSVCWDFVFGAAKTVAVSNPTQPRDRTGGQWHQVGRVALSRVFDDLQPSSSVV